MSVEKIPQLARPLVVQVKALLVFPGFVGQRQPQVSQGVGWVGSDLPWCLAVELVGPTQLVGRRGRAYIHCVGIVQLNQIRSKVSESVGDLVNVSDVKGDQDITRLTRGLAAWVVTQLGGMTPEQTAASVTDGYGDNGIDAIAVDAENSVVYVVQSKWDQKGTGSPALGDVLKFIQGFRDIINAEFDRFNDKVRAKQQQLEAALGDPDVRFVLVVAHTGQEPLSEEARNAVDDLLSELNEPIDTASFEMLTQRELHGFLTRDVHGAPPDLAVTLYDWGATQEPYAAYYGQVDASEVAVWFRKHGVRLFDKNIRQFLGQDSEVNASIIHTLRNQPDRFWYLNNGVTVLCERVTKSALGGATKKTGNFEFKGVSVVNGAQTVGCIGQASAEHPEAVADARVSIRFISLENCPPEFASEVTRGTNTQNRVERRDFVALDAQQERLVTELAVDGIRYAIKSGESAPDGDAGCTVVEATVALASAQPTPDLAVQAKREIGRLWVGAEEDDPRSQYRQLFNYKTTSIQVWRSVRVLRAIDSALAAERTKRQGRERLIGVHGNRLIAHQVFQDLSDGALTNPDVDFADVLSRVPAFVTKNYSATADVINSEYASNYLASLFKNATRCRDIVMTVSGSPAARP